MTENRIKQLGAPMPEAAIQRTKKSDTRKAYDTTGYGYQYCVDRFNEVCADTWGFEWEIIKETEGKYGSGKPFHSLTVELSIWVSVPENSRTCVGGHIGIDYADTLKGAITNAFKKTAAFWGVGADAFRGTIDDDANIPDSHNNITETSEKIRGNIEGLKKAISSASTDDELKKISTMITSRTWLNEEVEIATDLLVIRRKEIAEEDSQ